MLRGYKTELDLNNVQQTACLQYAGAARYAYNYGLTRAIAARDAGEKRPSAIDLHKEIVALKHTTHPWLWTVAKIVPQEALRDLDTAFSNFFRKCKLKKTGKHQGKCGFPKFKKRSKAIGSFRMNGAIHVYPDRIQLPRLGVLRLKESNYLPTDCKVHSATVSEKAGRWFVSVLVENEQGKPQVDNLDVIGVDLGIKQLATLSDGTVFDNPKAMKKSAKKLQRLQRELSRRNKGGMNRRKTRAKIAKQHMRIFNIRKDAAHKLTTYLTSRYGMVAIEDLNVSGMLKNHKLAGAISDSNFGEIRRQITYKSRWCGGSVHLVSRWFPSSKMCSACGSVKEKITLSERTFICDVCGAVLDRDLNAAVNLRNEALKNTVSSTGIYACGEFGSGLLAAASETGLIEAGTNQHLEAMALPCL